MQKMDLGIPDEHIHIICLKDSNVELDSTEKLEGNECVDAVYSNLSCDAEIEATDGRTDPLYSNFVTGDNNEYDCIECIDVLTEGSSDGNVINEYEYITLTQDIYSKMDVKKRKNVPTFPDRVTVTPELGDEQNIENKVESIEELEIEISTVTNKTKAYDRPRIRNIKQFVKNANNMKKVKPGKRCCERKFIIIGGLMVLFFICVLTIVVTLWYNAEDEMNSNEHNDDVTDDCFHVSTKCNSSIVENSNAVNKHTTDENATLLYTAAKNGHINEVKMLLTTTNALVDKVEADGGTPLLISAWNGFTEIAQLLLAYNASVDRTGPQGHTPLCSATFNGQLNVTKLLLRYNASVDKETAGGFNPLYLAAQNDHVKIAELLLNYNASVDNANANGVTPLWIAAQNGHVNVAQLLLKYNASVDKARSSDGVTPLFIAAQKGHVNVVEVLLKYNASVDEATLYGITPLYIAKKKGHVDIARLLVK